MTGEVFADINGRFVPRAHSSLRRPADIARFRDRREAGSGSGSNFAQSRRARGRKVCPRPRFPCCGARSNSQAASIWGIPKGAAASFAWNAAISLRADASNSSRAGDSVQPQQIQQRDGVARGLRAVVIVLDAHQARGVFVRGGEEAAGFVFQKFAFAFRVMAMAASR